MAFSQGEKIVTIANLKAAGTAKLPKVVQDYYNEGAMDMITFRDNEKAFERFKIRPRILTDVSDIDTSTSIFGQKMKLPIGFAPSAMHCLAHPDGEKGTSRAAAAMGIPMGLSTYSTVSLEDVALEGKQRGHNAYAFQLSIVKDRSTSLSWIKRAEASGYKALFITVDAPVLGQRINETRTPFHLPDNLSLPNLVGNGPNEDEASSRTHHHAGRDPSNSWASVIPWVKKNTKLEIWLKGGMIAVPSLTAEYGVDLTSDAVYCVEDVLLAIHHGLDGIIISNHGGRQLDGVPASIDALAECAPAAKGRIKIGIDGGIRRGSDIFKALALGADFCFLGRVALWGLAYDGQNGVERAIEILEEELRTTMALAGCKTIRDISRKHLSVIGSNGLLSKL